MAGWFYKYKIYHLLFWFCYHFAWWSVATGSPLEAANNILFSPYTTKFLFYVVFQALGVYFNFYYLMPKYLEKAKYVQYSFWLIITIIVTVAFILSGYYISPYVTGISFESLFKVGEEGIIQLMKSNVLPSTISSMTLAMSIKLGKKWMEVRNRQQLLEKEKIETELKFLKSQFNPHFLFNTINSIFVLIHKNPDMASDSLAKFSELLRYQLYECNESKIGLDREVNYLENFIELASLRLDKHVQLNVALDNNIPSGLQIAPFLLMPFIENAFKHVSQREHQENWLNIRLNITGVGLKLDVTNSISNQPVPQATLLESSGIGLKNVQRRLDLIYPDKHELKTIKNESSYRVTLTLALVDKHIDEGITKTKLTAQI